MADSKLLLDTSGFDTHLRKELKKQTVDEVAKFFEFYYWVSNSFGKGIAINYVNELGEDILIHIVKENVSYAHHKSLDMVSKQLLDTKLRNLSAKDQEVFTQILTVMEEKAQKVVAKYDVKSTDCYSYLVKHFKELKEYKFDIATLRNYAGKHSFVRMKAWHLRSYAEKMFLSGRFRSARRYTEISLSYDPSFRDSWLTLSLIHRCSGDVDRSAYLLRKSRLLKRRKEKYKSYLLYGIIHLLLGEYQDAVDNFVGAKILMEKEKDKNGIENDNVFLNYFLGICIFHQTLMLREGEERTRKFREAEAYLNLVAKEHLYRNVVLYLRLIRFYLPKVPGMFEVGAEGSDAFLFPDTPEVAPIVDSQCHSPISDIGEEPAFFEAAEDLTPPTTPRDRPLPLREEFPDSAATQKNLKGYYSVEAMIFRSKHLNKDLGMLFESVSPCVRVFNVQEKRLIAVDLLRQGKYDEAKDNLRMRNDSISNRNDMVDLRLYLFSSLLKAKESPGEWAEIIKSYRAMSQGFIRIQDGLVLPERVNSAAELLRSDVKAVMNTISGSSSSISLGGSDVQCIGMILATGCALMGDFFYTNVILDKLLYLSAKSMKGRHVFGEAYHLKSLCLLYLSADDAHLLLCLKEALFCYDGVLSSDKRFSPSTWRARQDLICRMREIAAVRKDMAKDLDVLLKSKPREEREYDSLDQLIWKESSAIVGSREVKRKTEFYGYGRKAQVIEESKSLSRLSYSRKYVKFKNDGSIQRKTFRNGETYYMEVNYDNKVKKIFRRFTYCPGDSLWISYFDWNFILLGRKHFNRNFEVDQIEGAFEKEVVEAGLYNGHRTLRDTHNNIFWECVNLGPKGEKRVGLDGITFQKTQVAHYDNKLRKIKKKMFFESNPDQKCLTVTYSKGQRVKEEEFNEKNYKIQETIFKGNEEIREQIEFDELGREILRSTGDQLNFEGGTKIFSSNGNRVIMSGSWSAKSKVINRIIVHPNGEKLERRYDMDLNLMNGDAEVEGGGQREAESVDGFSRSSSRSPSFDISHEDLQDNRIVIFDTHKSTDESITTNVMNLNTKIKSYLSSIRKEGEDEERDAALRKLYEKIKAADVLCLEAHIIYADYLYTLNRRKEAKEVYLLICELFVENHYAKFQLGRINLAGDEFEKSLVIFTQLEAVFAQEPNKHPLILLNKGISRALLKEKKPFSPADLEIIYEYYLEKLKLFMLTSTSSDFRIDVSKKSWRNLESSKDTDPNVILFMACNNILRGKYLTAERLLLKENGGCSRFKEVRKILGFISGAEFGRSMGIDTIEGEAAGSAEAGSVSAIVDELRAIKVGESPWREKALHRRSFDPYGLYIEGMALRMEGKFVTAIERYRRALFYRNEFSQLIRAEVGTCFLELGDLQSAIKWFSKIKEEIRPFAARIGLASVYYYQKRYAAALEEAKKAILLRHSLNAYILLIKICKKTGEDWKYVEGVCREALSGEAFETDADYLAAQGYLRLVLKDYVGALRAARRALERNPRHGPSLLLLGKICKYGVAWLRIMGIDIDKTAFDELKQRFYGLLGSSIHSQILLKSAERISKFMSSTECICDRKSQEEGAADEFVSILDPNLAFNISIRLAKNEDVAALVRARLDGAGEQHMVQVLTECVCDGLAVGVFEFMKSKISENKDISCHLRYLYALSGTLAVVFRSVYKAIDSLEVVEGIGDQLIQECNTVLERSNEVEVTRNCVSLLKVLYTMNSLAGGSVNALHAACTIPNTNVVSTALKDAEKMENGVETLLTGRNGDGDTPLHVLLQRSANFEEAGYTGTSVILGLLLETKVKWRLFESTNCDGDTPLHVLLKNLRRQNSKSIRRENMMDCVKAFLEYAKPNFSEEEVENIRKKGLTVHFPTPVTEIANYAGKLPIDLINDRDVMVALNDFKTDLNISAEPIRDMNNAISSKYGEVVLKACSDLDLGLQFSEYEKITAATRTLIDEEAMLLPNPIKIFDTLVGLVCKYFNLFPSVKCLKNVMMAANDYLLAYFAKMLNADSNSSNFFENSEPYAVKPEQLELLKGKKKFIKGYGDLGLLFEITKLIIGLEAMKDIKSTKQVLGPILMNGTLSTIRIALSLKSFDPMDILRSSVQEYFEFAKFAFDGIVSVYRMMKEVRAHNKIYYVYRMLYMVDLFKLEVTKERDGECSDVENKHMCRKILAGFVKEAQSCESQGWFHQLQIAIFYGEMFDLLVQKGHGWVDSLKGTIIDELLEFGLRPKVGRRACQQISEFVVRNEAEFKDDRYKERVENIKRRYPVNVRWISPQ